MTMSHLYYQTALHMSMVRELGKPWHADQWVHCTMHTMLQTAGASFILSLKATSMRLIYAHSFCLASCMSCTLMTAAVAFQDRLRWCINTELLPAHV